jgi:hypothetical protein
LADAKASPVVGLWLHGRISANHSKEITMNSAIELLPVAVVLGLFVLMIVPLFAMVALLLVALGGVAALVALTGAVLATPYLLGHSLLQHLRARRSAGRHQALKAHPWPPLATQAGVLADSNAPGAA